MGTDSPNPFLPSVKRQQRFAAALVSPIDWYLSGPVANAPRHLIGSVGTIALAVAILDRFNNVSHSLVTCKQCYLVRLYL